MRYALYVGCNIPARVEHYESSSRAVLGALGVEFSESKEFNCCGYPLRNVDRLGFVVSSAHNLAVAHELGSDMVVLCKCGFGTLKEAQRQLEEDDELRGQVNEVLGREGLRYDGGVKVEHLLSVLYHSVGVKAIKEKVTRKYKGLKIATHYGCHALRPSEVTGFDDPVSPSLFDELVKVTGAKSVEWERKLECCGAPLMGINDEVSVGLMKQKVEGARASGADYLCTGCPYCQLQFDTVQSEVNGTKAMGALLYPQLLGLSMGISEEELGLGTHKVDVRGVEGYLADKE